ATNTMTRWIPVSSNNNALSSSVVKTSGVRLRFALCRTSVMGLRSKNSHRTACENNADMMFRTFAFDPFDSFSVPSQDSTATVRTSDNEQAPHCGVIHLLMYPS